MTSTQIDSTTTGHPDCVIEISKLNFSYGGPLILNDIQFKLQRGSRCLLVGANGAGKSTLLTILAGKRMVRDKVLVFGKDAFNDSPPGITYLGTEWVNNPIVRGDVRVSTLLSKMNGDRYAERRDRLIQIMDINPDWHMHQVSDGERRRVQLVLGLIKPWELLLMDEVTVDLDVLVRADLLRFLKRETEIRGATIVYATHIFDGLGSWPTCVSHMKRGRIIASYEFSNFPELDAVIAEQVQLRSTLSSTALRQHMDSPLLIIVERWLREDLQELRALRDANNNKDEKDRPRTRWDELEDDVNNYGDKYYNYWK
ncbi:3465_t:CDS:2 [Paraglomus brasilianum]|uniref:3465_t:CDS:1 n=1 Tax=Paraglomus brasilianum TaxID=144538 RepID=A0A9N8WGP7_9GLOM|nr:3465_t:CDS:2 [Paraglomus brasilianum]